MKTKILVSIVLLSISITAVAQNGVLYRETSPEGTVTFAKLSAGANARNASESHEVLKEVLSLKNNDELRLQKTDLDNLGFSHQYFQQYYKAVRVEYGVYSVHSRNNVIETINGLFFNLNNLDVRYSLTESQALGFALGNIRARLYKWQIPQEEKWISEKFKSSYYPKGELIIIKDESITKQFRVAWKFDIYAHEPLGRYYIFVDANSGSIIKKNSRIHHANSNGSGDTRYNGNQNFVTDSFAGGFRLRETRNSVRIETYNMRLQGTNYVNATDFVDNNNTWTNGEFHNANMDDAALDAHWSTEMVYDYFNTVHSRNSYDGAGGALLSYVHTNLVAFGYPNNNNAFWDGQRMTYGDGDGTTFTPLTSLDVCAHEIGHGVCEFTARFDYQGESGAINEGFSDIWAACIERWAAPAKQTWIIGEDFNLTGNPLRSMSDPNAGTPAQPDTYGGTNWFSQSGCTPSGGNDQCGVHTNSGVLNFWFFLLSDGGNGTNDNSQAFDVWGVGIDKAALIAYRTERFVLTQPTPPAESSTTFSQLRTATIQAATDIYGSNSCEVRSVTNAWQAVGVGSGFVDNMSVSGPALVCTDGTFTLNNPLNLDNSTNHVTWSVDPSYLVTVSNGTGVSTDLTKAGNGNPTISYSPGCGINNVSLQFHTGPYSSSDYPITGPSSAPCNNYVYYSIPNLSGATSINWLWPSGWTYVSGQGTPYLALRIKSSGVVSVGVNNTCGISGSYYTKVTSMTGSCPMGMSIYPNPASEELNITFIDDNSTPLETGEFESPYDLKIYNNMQELVFHTQSNSLQLRIDTRPFPKGSYILNLTNKEGIIQKKVFIVK